VYDPDNPTICHDNCAEGYVNTFNQPTPTPTPPTPTPAHPGDPTPPIDYSHSDSTGVSKPGGDSSPPGGWTAAIVVIIFITLAAGVFVSRKKIATVPVTSIEESLAPFALAPDDFASNPTDSVLLDFDLEAGSE